ncbi:nuclear polyadenylated RNA-binding protein 3-like [Nicotiana tomentosiformis]|uniref:nuclear polyadenylated RNA-binding protein 3-like n=1 Tax=Nicotiana tomentosiformis TaxID=4098 RepID=UPI00388C61F7
MVRLSAEGEAKTLTDKSVSDNDDTAFLNKTEMNEMMNNLEATKVVSETGGSEEAYVELALSEQSVIVYQDDGTAIQEENNITEVELPNEEYSLKEVKSNQTDGVLGEGGENFGEERNDEDATDNGEDNDLENGKNTKEKNEGGAETLNGECLLKEEGYNQTDAVVGEEDDDSGIDNSEDNNQENVKNIEEKNEEGVAGVDKDNKGDTMEEDAIDNDEDINQENRQITVEKNEGGVASVDKDNKRHCIRVKPGPWDT